MDGLSPDEWSGVCLGDFLNRRFVPNHALAMCLKREQFEGVEADAETALRDRYIRKLHLVKNEETEAETSDNNGGAENNANTTEEVTPEDTTTTVMPRCFSFFCS